MLTIFNSFFIFLVGVSHSHNIHIHQHLHRCTLYDPKIIFLVSNTQFRLQLCIWKIDVECFAPNESFYTYLFCRSLLVCTFFSPFHSNIWKFPRTLEKQQGQRFFNFAQRLPTRLIVKDIMILLRIKSNIFTGKYQLSFPKRRISRQNFWKN